MRQTRPKCETELLQAEEGDGSIYGNTHVDGRLLLCGDSISRSRRGRLPCKGSLSPGDLCRKGVSAPEKTSLTS